MSKKFALILTIFATVTLTFATTSPSSAPSQGAGKVSMRDFSFVVITGDAIRRLPSGENNIYIATSSGGVWKTTNGGTSWNLTKTGPDTWTMSSNTYRGLTAINEGVQTSANNNSSASRPTGVTKTGAGTLEHSGSGAGLNKVGPGTLILPSSAAVVYEFRNLGSPEFDRIFMPGGANLKTYVQRHRPPGAMRGWPFQRLLIGPAKGIAQYEGWKIGNAVRPTPPRKDTTCSGSWCACSGFADCLNLAASGVCSDLTCDGSSGDIKCYCSTR